LKYILRYIGAVIHFKVNINEEACSWRCNSWCMVCDRVCASFNHPPHNYNLYQSWGLGISMEFVSKVWTWKLCLFVEDVTFHIGRDDWLYHFTCEEGFDFSCFVIGRFIWSNMERPCVELCTMSPFTCGWPSESINGHNTNKFAMHVMWIIMRCSNHVSLWPLVWRMVYGQINW
jgi:hypothetical protein